MNMENAKNKIKNPDHKIAWNKNQGFEGLNVMKIGNLFIGSS